MVKAVGKEVLYLKRIRMGKFWLPKDLNKGQYRPMTKEELEQVREKIIEWIAKRISRVVVAPSEKQTCPSDFRMAFVKFRLISVEATSEHRLFGIRDCDKTFVTVPIVPCDSELDSKDTIS